MKGIQYHKRWQWVWRWYRDMRYYNHAYIFEVGYLKIDKYPQEYGNTGDGDWLNYEGSHKGVVVSLRVSIPKVKLIGPFYFKVQSAGIRRYRRNIIELGRRYVGSIRRYMRRC